MAVGFTTRGIIWVSQTVSQATSANNWAPTGLSGAIVLYVSLSGFVDVTVTGLTGGEDGRLLFIVNTSSANLFNVANQSASSSAANRFVLDSGATTSLFPGDSIALLYDGIAQRWKQAMRYA